MNDTNLARFKGAPWFAAVQQRDVAIVGAGGVGSWLALLLSRVNIKKIYLYDHDVVDESNIAGQLFSRDQVGGNKVGCVAKNLGIFSGYYNIQGMARKVLPGDTIGQGDIFSCVDTMLGRRTIFDIFKANATPGQIFIDARLAAERFQVYCVPFDEPEVIKKYEESLLDDSQVPTDVCTYKQTTHFATMVSSFMVKNYINHVHNQLVGDYVFDVPFMEEYVGATGMLTRKEAYE
jgi:molybdopterin/thiamine biosynthesis adenylyltransferase